MDNILDAVRDEFFSRLQTNTTWGRNQIKELYTQCERDVLVRNLNKSEVIPENPSTVAIREHFKHLETNKSEGELKNNRWHPAKDYEDDNPFKDDEDINKG